MTLLACSFKTGDDLIKLSCSFPPEIIFSHLNFWCFNLIGVFFSGEGAAGSNYGYTNSGYSVYEEENEKLTESLRSKVTAIKSVSMSLY